MPLASWHGHIFEVTQKTIRSFEDLMFKAGCDTEDKTSGTDKWEALKTSDPVSVSLTANLRSYFGVDVRKEAEGLMEDARTGAKDYFYLGGTKLFGCLMMLKQAEISETHVGVDGFLQEAKCALSLVQCEKWGGGTGTGTGGGGTGGTGKASVKTLSPTQESTVAKAIVTGAALGAAATQLGTTTTKLGPTDTQAAKARAVQAQKKANAISTAVTQAKIAKTKSYGKTSSATTPQAGKIKQSMR